MNPSTYRPPALSTASFIALVKSWMWALPFLYSVLKPISCPLLLRECYSGRQFPQHVQNNTQANIPQPAMGTFINQPLHCKYDHWLLCLQCKTASKPGSEMSVSSLKINKWAEEAPLLCKGRTRSVLSPKMCQYTRTPREVQAERSFHIWMIKTCNHLIHFYHHSTFTALSII